MTSSAPRRQGLKGMWSSAVLRIAVVVLTIIFVAGNVQGRRLKDSPETSPEYPASYETDEDKTPMDQRPFSKDMEGDSNTQSQSRQVAWKSIIGNGPKDDSGQDKTLGKRNKKLFRAWMKKREKLTSEENDSSSHSKSSMMKKREKFSSEEKESSSHSKSSMMKKREKFSSEENDSSSHSKSSMMKKREKFSSEEKESSSHSRSSMSSSHVSNSVKSSSSRDISSSRIGSRLFGRQMEAESASGTRSRSMRPRSPKSTTGVSVSQSPKRLRRMRRSAKRSKKSPKTKKKSSKKSKHSKRKSPKSKRKSHKSKRKSHKSKSKKKSHKPKPKSIKVKHVSPKPKPKPFNAMVKKISPKPKPISLKRISLKRKNSKSKSKKHVSKKSHKHSPKSKSKKSHKHSPKSKSKKSHKHSPKSKSKKSHKHSPKSKSKKSYKHSPKSLGKKSHKHSHKSKSKKSHKHSPKSKSKKSHKRSPKSKSKKSHKRSPKGKSKSHKTKSHRKPGSPSRRHTSPEQAQKIRESLELKRQRHETTCECMASGDPHYKTFDGAMIHFMGVCEYTMVRYRDEANEACAFEVSVENEHRNHQTRVSHTKRVNVRIYGLDIALMKDRKVLINGVQRYAPLSIDTRVEVDSNMREVTLLTQCGMEVSFKDNHLAKILIPKKFSKSISGLCGDCNGDTQNDYRLANGSDVTKARDRDALIGQSYATDVMSDDLPESCTTTVSVPSFTCPDQFKTRSENQCRLLINNAGPFNKCINQLKQEARRFYDGCIQDVCAASNAKASPEDAACQAMEAMAEECADLGLEVRWRSRTLCPMECPQNSHYSETVPACPPSCNDRKSRAKRRCARNLSPGCQCNQGFLLDNGQCVPVSRCGCYDAKRNYIPTGASVMSRDCKQLLTCRVAKDGQRTELVETKKVPCGKKARCRLRDGVRQCRCRKGYQGDGYTCERTTDPNEKRKERERERQRNLVKRDRARSLCECSGSGDPHYQTFDSQMIHFQGSCKYILSQSVKINDTCQFKVMVKNEHRNNNMRVTFTREVHVQSQGVKIALLPGKKIMVNQERYFAPVVLSEAGLTITEAGNMVEVVSQCGLEVAFDGVHRVYVRVPRSMAGRLNGLCGDCNRRPDDFRTSEGIDVSDQADKYSLIGNSYLVKEDLSAGELEQCGHVPLKVTCDAESLSVASHTDRCGALTDPKGPFGQCARALRDKATEIFDNCVMDLCAFVDQPEVVTQITCMTGEVLAGMCKSVGIVVLWRPTLACPLQCPPNSHYNPTMAGCQSTCLSPAPELCRLAEREGCECDEGFVLDNGKCIETEDCGCRDANNLYIPLGVSYVRRDCRTRVQCQASRYGSMMMETTSDRQPCSPQAVCVVLGRGSVCRCRPGFHGNGHVCIEKTTTTALPPPPPTLPPQMTKLPPPPSPPSLPPIPTTTRAMTVASLPHPPPPPPPVSTPIVPPQTPELPPQTPELPPQTPELPPQTPELPPQTPEIPPQTPELPPQTPELPPQTPELPPQTPELPPQTPKLPPQTPKLPPQTPKLPPQTPKLPPQTPDLPPQTPKLPQQTPELPPQTPELPPQTPELPPQTPELPPQTPELPPQTPELPPQTPKLPPQSPELPPQTPKLPPQTPKLPPQTPKLPPQTPELPAATKPRPITMAIEPPVHMIHEVHNVVQTLTTQGPDKGACVCHATGDPHYKTFDGAHLEIYDPCKYIMAETRDKSTPCSFRVEVKNEKRPHSEHPKRSYTRLVDIRLPRDTIRLHVGGKVFFNNKPLPPGFTNGDLTITKDGPWINVTTLCGLNVAFDGDKKAVVQMASHFRGSTLGLCGNCDANAENDVEVEGKPVFTFDTIWEGYHALAKQFLIADDSDKPDTSLRCEPPLQPYGYEFEG